MSARTPPVHEAVERVVLTDGWQAVGVPPGATDHRLEGLDDDLVAFTAPGTAAEALRDAGLWSTALQRDLDAEDWWFRGRFHVPPSDPDTDTRLELAGVATVADIWMNGEHVACLDNMHTAHELPLSGGDTELVIGVKALAPLLAERRPRPRWRTRLVASQNMRWHRTTLFGRLPGFAPGPAPVGPWRPVSCVRRRFVAVEDLRLRTSVEGRTGMVRIHGMLRCVGGFEARSASLRIRGAEGAVEAPLEIQQRGRDRTVAGALSVPDVHLWWPHTHGDPVLYDAELVVRGERDASSVVLHAGRIGFRTTAYTEDPGLAVTVNGVDVFCRGGALLPDGVTLDRPPGGVRGQLELLRSSGVNMIRLSGVGTYASSELLDACDELGMLVWQDFPFANLDYPIEDEPFRSSVEREVTQFLARSGHRPSLTILCGNSEIEQQVAMLGLDPALGRGVLFGELLPALIAGAEVDAHYIPSSPTGGTLPFRPHAGVAHYFGVGAYRQPLTDARRAEVRFASECLAFANVPEDEEIDGLAPDGSARLVHHPAWKRGVPRDVGAGWDFDDVRDHYLGELFKLDPIELRWADPDRYLAVSRVVSGEMMAATVGEWRRARSGCAGALVWTLTDPIPGAGWGILDSGSRPKAAYWYLKRAFAPVAVWMTDEGTNGIAVHVANDTAGEIRARLTVALVRADGRTTAEGTAELELPAHTTIERDAESVLGSFADASYAFRFGPQSHECVSAVLEMEEDSISAAHFPSGPPRHARPIGDLGLEVGCVNGGECIRLTLSSGRVAYAVKLDVPGWIPSDNYLTVVPGAPKTVDLTPRRSGGEFPGGAVRPLNGDGHVAVPAGAGDSPSN